MASVKIGVPNGRSTLKGPAASVFEEVGGSDASTADLRTLTAGFRDLAAAAIQATPPGQRRHPPTPKSATPTEPVIYGNQELDCLSSGCLARSMPVWNPSALERGKSAINLSGPS